MPDEWEMSKEDDAETDAAKGSVLAKATGTETGKGDSGNAGLGCVIMLVIAGALFFGLRSCIAGDAQPSTDEPQPEVVAAPSPPSPRDVGEPSNTTVMAGAMSAVKRKMVDPGSAQFRNVRAYPQSSGTTAICGEVNAKNRAGGYNGYQRFISAGTDRHTWLEQDIEDIDAVWGMLCK